jgi:hypothetical protein
MAWAGATGRAGIVGLARHHTASHPNSWQTKCSSTRPRHNRRIDIGGRCWALQGRSYVLRAIHVKPHGQECVCGHGGRGQEGRGLGGEIRVVIMPDSQGFGWAYTHGLVFCLLVFIGDTHRA